MFFLIPFGILLVSLIAIVWITSRKFVYLRKLTPEVLEGTSEVQESFWAEFFPGLTKFFGKVDLREYRLRILAESEKTLRKLRLLSLKIDTVTNSLIHRVRKSVVHHEGIINEEASAKLEQESSISIVPDSKKDPKEHEQELIIKIAKDPKNPQLYKKLGNIYTKVSEWHDAAESFKKVLELDPEDQATRTKLEKIVKKLEKVGNS